MHDQSPFMLIGCIEYLARISDHAQVLYTADNAQAVGACAAVR